MIDPDAQRRVHDAELATGQANANDSAAAETREFLRDDIDRSRRNC